MDKPWINTGEDLLSFVISEQHHDVRLDQFLARAVDEFSRSRITSAVKAGAITVNDNQVKPGYRLRAGDAVRGTIKNECTLSAPDPQDVDFTVLIEDRSFIVLTKPAGIVVHPGSGNHDHTLVNGLLYRYGDLKNIGDADRPGIVHRLDKDTSGVMVVARTANAHANLAKQFKDRMVHKTYLALIHGIPGKKSGRIVAPIGRHPVNRQKMTIREHDGRYAVSNWKCVEVYKRHSLVEITIETGRTHQIRVHMASIGFPVAGDRVYGSHRDNKLFPRQLLHSWKLCFHHPETDDEIKAEAALPEDFRDILVNLGNERC